MGSSEEKQTPFHVFHKVPAGDGLYVRAKHMQLVERNPNMAIELFQAAIHAGDRVDSALKDMAIVMKQQNRSEEAILAISSCRSRCSAHAQDSLDNVLLDLYKSCGRLEDQIALLIQKLKPFHSGQAFNGKRTKTARSQGKKFQVSVDQEAARLLVNLPELSPSLSLSLSHTHTHNFAHSPNLSSLHLLQGNLGWAYMQQPNYIAAESAYRRALALEVDNNKLCNLGVCLMEQGKLEEAMAVLRRASSLNSRRGNSESYLKSYERAQELILQASSMLLPIHHRLLPDELSSMATTTSRDTSSIAQHSREQGQEQRQRPNITDISSNNGKKLNINQEAKKMSEMVAAAAWMLACNGEQQGADDGSSGDDIIVTKHQDIGHGHACEEGSNHHKDAIEANTFSLPSSIPSLSPSYLMSGVYGRRRLPVFQDLTILGSAAA